MGKLFGWLAAFAWVAAQVFPASAQPHVNPLASDPQLRAQVSALSERMRFEVLADPIAYGHWLPEPQRTAASRLSMAQMNRVRDLLLQWMHKEPGLDDAVVAHRMLNAYALFGLDTLGTAQDERWLQVLAHPRACKGLQVPAGSVQGRAWLLRVLGDEDREAAIADELKLIERWGSQMDLPSAQAPFDLLGIARRLRQQQSAPEPPMPPNLMEQITLRSPEAPNAWAHLGDEPSCQLMQWALRAELARGVAPVLALARWRETAKFGVAEAARKTRQELVASKDGQAPALLRKRIAAGQVVVRVEGSGKLSSTTIVSRKLRVVGLPPGARAAGFEQAADDFAVAQALSRRAGGGASTAPREITIGWGQP